LASPAMQNVRPKDEGTSVCVFDASTFQAISVTRSTASAASENRRSANYLRHRFSNSSRVNRPNPWPVRTPTTDKSFPWGSSDMQCQRQNLRRAIKGCHRADLADSCR
jgi:hypothetical protein